MLQEPAERSAPEIAVQLLDDLDRGHVLYVAERQGRSVGFAQVSGPTIGDGGHVVELRSLYIGSEYRHSGLGRQLLRFVLRDVRQRPDPPALRAWAASGSAAAGFLQAAGGQAVRERWKVGQGLYAVRGIVFDWLPPVHSNGVRSAVNQPRRTMKPQVHAWDGALRA